MAFMTKLSQSPAFLRDSKEPGVTGFWTRRFSTCGSRPPVTCQILILGFIIVSNYSYEVAMKSL